MWNLPDGTERKKPTDLNTKTRHLLESLGWQVELTQSFNAHSYRSKDLFGFGDLLAINDNLTVLVQACGKGDKSKRRRKILSECGKEARRWLMHPARMIWIISWTRPSAGSNVGWMPDVEEITLEDLNAVEAE